MKINRPSYEDLVYERFTSQENKDKHWKKHIKKLGEYNISPDEYESQAEILSKTPVDNKTIFGYECLDTETNKHSYIKWNKDTELLVSYFYKGNEPITITAFRRSFRDYNGKKYIDGTREYFGEIPPGK